MPTDPLPGAPVTPPAGGAPGAALNGTPPPSSQGGAATPPPSSSTDPYWKDLVGPDGKLNHAAYDRLPEHLKGSSEDLKRFSTVDDLLFSYQQNRQLVGKKGLNDLQPLPPGSPPEAVKERNALIARLQGVPEKPEAYGIKRPDGFPAENWPQAHVDNIVRIAHENNISPAGLQALVKAQTEAVAAEVKASEQFKEQFYSGHQLKINETLAKENMERTKADELVARAARTAGLKPDDPIFKNSNAYLLALRFAQSVGEGRLVEGDHVGPDIGANEQAAYDAIVHDRTSADGKAYWDASNPRHKEVVEKANRILAAVAARAAKAAGRAA